MSIKRPTKSQTRMFLALIDRLEPAMRKAFMDAMLDWRRNIDWKALLASLERRDVDAAVAALNLSPAALSAFAETKRAAFMQGGLVAVDTVNLPSGSTVAVRFDMTNPAAERWVSENVANRVTQIVDEQVSSVRATILSGYSEGNHPEKIAIDIGGRMVNGRRQGGIIGLSDPQHNYVASMRSRLESADPDQLRKILSGMSRRDKRYDALIAKHIESGKPIPADKIARMVERYSDRLLALRSETIARSETGMAVMGGRAEEWRQAVETFGYQPDAVIKTWRHGLGTKEPRTWHVAMNGQSVTGLNTPFVLGSGAVMQYALDPSGGAKECANCGCDTTFRLRHDVGLD